MTDKIAILIDGGFFLKRLKILLRDKQAELSQDDVIRAIGKMSYNHVCKHRFLDKHHENDDWTSYIYRTFYYDAKPYDEKRHHPITKRQIDYSRTSSAKWRRELFQKLRRHPKMALRLGEVLPDSNWQIHQRNTKQVIKTKELITSLNLDNVQSVEASTKDEISLRISKSDFERLRHLSEFWKDFTDDQVNLSLRQKGVDMRIGLDISTLSLKKQVSTIVLVTGDSDFVPAAKLARREGIHLVLDSMWHNVNDNLYEHIDLLYSGFREKNKPT